MNLNQVTVPSLNVERSKDFYVQLGLKLIVDALPRYVRLECPDGDSTLSIHIVDQLGSNTGITLYFEHDQLDDKVKDLKDLGITFEGTTEDKPWLWREAHLKDPDGHQLILFKAGENRKNPPWRVVD
ncbi:MAG: VOC family protein [Winogradskyella sp.]|nr:VOC family protein [Winogradskyella sp.]